MATRRKRKDEDDPRWHEALHKAQDWDEAGISHRMIAKRLNAEGFSIGYGKAARSWEDWRVTQALDRYPKYPVEYPLKWPGEPLGFDPNDTISVPVFNDDGTRKKKDKELGTAWSWMEMPGETEAEQIAAYLKLKAEAMEAAQAPRDARSWPKRTYPEPKPKDWTAELDFTDTWMASEDGWDKNMLPLVARHIRATGWWSFLDRIDRMEGDSTDKAKLRWQYLGLLRRLGMRDETVLALKDEISKLRAGWRG